MTKAELEQTAWAKEFAEDSPVSYREALLLAAEPGGLKVDVEPATTLLGDPCYAIIVADRRSRLLDGPQADTSRCRDVVQGHGVACKAVTASGWQH